jgi:uncharacterized protein
MFLAESVASVSHRTSPSQQPKPSSGFRRLRRLLLICVVLPYVGLVLLLAINQRSLLFPATQVDSLPVTGITGFPQEQLRDVEITTADGLTISGWHFLAETPEESAPSGVGNRRLVIYFHGNAGHRAHRVPEALEFVQEGCDVLLIDYRGYGDSEGSPSREGLVQDAVATWEHAIDELGCTPDRIIVFGESLGGAVAVELACHCCGNNRVPAGMLLTSTFANLPETAARLYPMFPVRWLVRDRFSSRDLITQVTCPIVQLHGESDELVTLKEGQELFEAAPAASASGIPKRFELLENTDHNTVPPAVLGQALRELLNSLDAE